MSTCNITLNKRYSDMCLTCWLRWNSVVCANAATPLQRIRRVATEKRCSLTCINTLNCIKNVRCAKLIWWLVCARGGATGRGD